MSLDRLSLDKTDTCLGIQLYRIRIMECLQDREVQRHLSRHRHNRIQGHDYF
jgi:hypothetical protein